MINGVKVKYGNIIDDEMAENLLNEDLK